jgi:oligopeptide transport system ATP-binding protein
VTIPNEQTGRDAPTIVEVSPADARRLVTEEKVSLDKRPKAEKLLTVRGLSTHFFTPDGVVQAVDDVSFELGYGETLGLVGESGCGKSVSALSVARLVPNPPGRIVAGEIVFDGIDVLRLGDDDMRKLRGKEIGFIFQDPLTSLNPTLTIGYQIAEAIKQHMGLSAKASTDRVVELLSKVGIPRAKDRLNDYPHQFSGGMRQRVMIAIALSCDPKLILADEPTTALDVTIQAQILDLLRQLVAERDTALIMITHDLGVVAGMCERVNVMYAGTFLETGSAEQVFGRPRNPYTLGLLQSVPRLDAARRARLQPIEGVPRNMLSPPQACPFQPRCRYEVELSRQEVPPLEELEPGHKVACFNPVPVEEWERMKTAVVS